MFYSDWRGGLDNPALKIRPYTRPPTRKPRKLTAEKHLAQMIKACGADWLDDTTREHAYVGRPYPDGYVTRATDGQILILQRGEGQGEPIRRLSPVLTYPIVITDPTFELVLKRARVCANERSHAIRFTVLAAPPEAYAHELGVKREPGLLVEASKVGDWSSQEFFSCDVPTGLYGARWCLNADYLLAACGRWPWRWEVPAIELAERGAAYGPKQLHGPDTDAHVIYWNEDGTAVLIMPMRV